MLTCDKCGKELKCFSEVFNCHRCNGVFCTKHRLPENHNCTAFEENMFTKKAKRQLELAKDYKLTHEPTFWDKVRLFFHKLKK